MNVLELAWNWNATDEEWRTAFPCDKYVRGPHRVCMRAIDVEAPAGVTYRWICQVKLAAYSYDLFDNWGRRSPRQLTPGAEKLVVGERFLSAFHIVEFEPDRHVTVVANSVGGWLGGNVALTYAATPRGPGASRLIVKFDMECETRWQLARQYVLAWGDLIMMRKQFLTLKALAEETARGATSA